MADVTRDVVARLKVEKDGDASAFREAAEDIKDLGEAVASSKPAIDGTADSLGKAGQQAEWVARTTESIIGPSQAASTAQRELGGTMQDVATSTEKAGGSVASLTGLMTALLLKIDPTKANLEQLSAAYKASVGITETLAHATGVELPDSYAKATAAASRFVEALATGKLSKAFDELKSYMQALSEYAADSIMWVEKMAGAGAKANDQLLDSMKGAREELQATLKAQRDLTDAREKEAAAMTQQAAVLERQIKAEQQSGEVTKQTAEAAQDLLDRYEDVGRRAPEAFERAAKAAGVMSSATERAAKAADELDAAAGDEGAASGIGALSAAVTQVVDPLTDFATKAQTAAEALGKDEFAEPGKGMDQLAEAADAAGASVDDAASSVTDLGDTVDDLGPRFDDLRDTATEAFGGISSAAALTVRELNATMPKAFDAMIENAKRSNDALFGLTPGPAKTPTDTQPTAPGGDDRRQEADTRAAENAAADVEKAMGAATKAIEATNAAGERFVSEVAPAIVTGLGDIASASVFGEDGGLGSLQTQLESLAAIEFAAPILEQLNQIVSGAQAAAQAIAAIGDAAGDEAAPAAAPSSGPSSFQTGAG